MLSEIPIALASGRISELYQELNIASILSLVDLIFSITELTIFKHRHHDLASVVLKPVTSFHQEIFFCCYNKNSNGLKAAKTSILEFSLLFHCPNSSFSHVTANSNTH